MQPNSEDQGHWNRVSSTLAKVAHGSAPFITTFLVIHLTAPAMANLGGTSLASQVMLLGREYYQTSFGHKYLVLLPIFIHSTSAIAKRVLTYRRARRFRSLLSLTGYATMLFFAPVHYMLHRVSPRDTSLPIDSLAPSELDYEYVKFGLQEWPIRSWFLYAGLTACVAWHAAEGMHVIWNTHLKESLGAWKITAKSRAIGATMVILPVVSGIFVMWREPLMVFTSSVARFQAAFTKNLLYRL